MVKTTVYLRVAKTRAGVKVAASTKPNYAGLWNGQPGHFGSKPYPTVLIAVELDIPDSRFKAAEAEVALKIKNAALATGTEAEALRTPPKSKDSGIRAGDLL